MKYKVVLKTQVYGPSFFSEKIFFGKDYVPNSVNNTTRQVIHYYLVLKVKKIRNREVKQFAEGYKVIKFKDRNPIHFSKT